MAEWWSSLGGGHGWVVVIAGWWSWLGGGLWLWYTKPALRCTVVMPLAIAAPPVLLVVKCTVVMPLATAAPLGLLVAGYTVVLPLATAAPPDLLVVNCTIVMSLSCDCSATWSPGGDMYCLLRLQCHLTYWWWDTFFLWKVGSICIWIKTFHWGLFALPATPISRNVRLTNRETQCIGVYWIQGLFNIKNNVILLLKKETCAFML